VTKRVRVSDVRQNKHDPILVPGLGILVASAFGIWAGRRHLYPPLVTSLAFIITGIIARVLATMSRKTLAGWAATAFLAWWAFQNPADAGRMAANVAVFMSTAKAGVGHFIAST
jgi:hypothetical protein